MTDLDEHPDNATTARLRYLKLPDEATEIEDANAIERELERLTRR